MQLDVIFSDEAIETFESIGLQIQARWGEKEAKSFRKRTYKVTEIIGKFPLMFQAVNQTQNIRKAFILKTVPCFMLWEARISRYFSFGITDRTQYFFRKQ